jgi:UDP-N-acetyl-D-mannosaminuronic acid dehydrogenase
MTESGDPDLSIVEDVVSDVAAGLAPGDAVFVESTVPPRTCRDRLLPRLEAESGLSLGEFGLAFCPERTSSGRALRDIRRAHPKVVGGADRESTRVAELVYGELTDNDVVAVSDATTAETVKVFEGVYRDVNIALANELARHATEFGVDVTEAADAANTQPFCDVHTPGIGVGGHCIPYYTQFLTETFETDAPLMETARAVNDEMPVYAAARLLDGLAEEGTDPADARVLVLGAAYRAGVDEIRKTPALPVVEHLVEAGATVRVTDPVASDVEPFEAAGADTAATVSAGDGPFDAVVLVTAHEAFQRLDVPALGPADGRLVLVDGRQAFTNYRDHLDVRYRGIGLDD